MRWEPIVIRACYWIYPAFIGMVALFVWTAFRMRCSMAAPEADRVARICLILAFAMWKTAFTREYPSYAFSTLLISLAVVGAPLLNRRLWLTSLLVVGVTFFGVARLGPGTYVNVVANARSLASEAVTAVVPSIAQEALEGTRATLRSKYRIDATTLGSWPDGASRSTRPRLEWRSRTRS